MAELDIYAVLFSLINLSSSSFLANSAGVKVCLSVIRSCG